jgi:hypothetical protein
MKEKPTAEKAKHFSKVPIPQNLRLNQPITISKKTIRISTTNVPILMKMSLHLKNEKDKWNNNRKTQKVSRSLGMLSFQFTFSLPISCCLGILRILLFRQYLFVTQS